jgi:hypothetical protein
MKHRIVCSSDGLLKVNPTRRPILVAINKLKGTRMQIILVEIWENKIWILCLMAYLLMSTVEVRAIITKARVTHIKYS